MNRAFIMLSLLFFSNVLCFMGGYNSGYNNGYTFASSSEQEACKKQVDSITKTVD